MDNITEFFYIRAAERIRKKVNQSGLPLAEIHKTDSKQISRIINNKRTPNNRFLICDSAISSTTYINEKYKSESTGLLHTLDFKNKKEIFWGTDEEIKSYIFDLFLLLWEEIYSDTSIDLDKELILCDYIPYAKYSTYWNILFNPDRNDTRFYFDNYEKKIQNFPAQAFGIYEDEVIENIYNARQNAILFLYNRCKDDFWDIFNSFAEETLSFHIIDRVIKKSFIEKRFIPLLIGYIPDEKSLGLRVRNLIQEDLSYCAALYYKKNINNTNYHKELINASSAYIVRLEKIQSKVIQEMY